MLSFKITGAVPDRLVLVEILRRAADSIVDKTRNVGEMLEGVEIHIMGPGGSIILKAERIEPKTINTEKS